MRKLVLALLLFGLLSGAALLVLWFALGPPADGIHLVINGDEVQWAQLQGWHAAGAGLATLFTLCIVALVLPLALLMGLLLPLLLVLGAVLLVLGAAAGIGALALSPLLLPLLLLWWLWRRSRRRAAPTNAAAGTNIGP